jgi:hypothetical protein
MTAMVLLTANSMHTPTHDDFFFDSHLVETGLEIIKDIMKETESETLRSFQAVCTELHQRMQQKCAEAVAIMPDTVDYSACFIDTQHEIEGISHHDDF